MSSLYSKKNYSFQKQFGQTLAAAARSYLAGNLEDDLMESPEFDWYWRVYKGEKWLDFEYSFDDIAKEVSKKVHAKVDSEFIKECLPLDMEIRENYLTYKGVMTPSIEIVVRKICNIKHNLDLLV